MESQQITGLTIAKNIVSRDYPLKFALETVRDLFDELVIVYGKSNDKTLEVLKEFSLDHGNVKIIQVKWVDGRPNELGRVTNVGLKKCTNSWIYYFQADEFADKRKHESIRQAVNTSSNSFLFPFVHFSGGIGHLQSKPPYNYAVRLFRNKKFGVSSDRDAWSFTGYKIWSAFQINRIFPTAYLEYPIYHAHNFTKNLERETARSDNSETGERIVYSGFLPPELINYYELLKSR